MTDLEGRTIPNEPGQQLPPLHAYEPPAPRRATASANGHAQALPHDLDAEKALLGAAMLGAAHILTQVPPDAFYAPAHGHLAQAIQAIADEHGRGDAVLVADWLASRDLLDQVGGPALLAEAMRDCGHHTTAPRYANIVLDHWRARTLITAARQLEITVRHDGARAGHRYLTNQVDTLRSTSIGIDPDPDFDTFLGLVDDDYDWIVPGLLEHRDRVILTAVEGGGKSTLLRQIAVQLASGIAPFTLDPIEPRRVLYVDCENTPRQARRALSTLRAAAADHYTDGRLRLRILGEAMALANPDIEVDLAARIIDHQADVVILGPLYKLITDDPIKEQPAKAVADAIDRLRNIRGSAFLIEAHSPYAESSSPKNRPIRPYGASLWSRWPEFGIHLDDQGHLKHWRGQRDQRTWPTKLQHDTPWPWAPAPDQPENTWDGPTECADAIVAFLEEAGGTFSVRQLETHLRERGRGYRSKTIGDAARLAHSQDRITCETGPRGALQYSARTLSAEPFEDF